jgi:glucokinase
MAVNLELADVPLRDLMGDRLGMPVVIDNDANLALLAEHRFGAARAARNAAMLTIGTGIGGGLVIEGRLYRGTTGAAGELGHIVIQADGPRCQGNCPNRGCVESLASGTAIAREGLAAAERAPDSALGRARAAGEAVDGTLVTEAALEGDETAREVIALVGRRSGVALSSLANALEPDVVVIGGGAIKAGDLLVEPARRELAARALPPMNRTPVAAAELGPEAGMIGAATMAALELEGGER